MGEVRAGLDQAVEIVPADPSLDPRIDPLDLVAMGLRQRQHPPGEVGDRSRAGDAVRIVAGRPEVEGGAVVEQRVEAEHVVAHLAVAQRAGAAGIVARHAADGAAARRRGLHGEEPAIGAQPRVEPFQHVARLDRDGAGLRVVGADAVEVARAVEDEARSDRLAVLRGAAPAQDHGTPCSAATPRQAATSSALRGRTTPAGMIW